MKHSSNLPMIRLRRAVVVFLWSLSSHRFSAVNGFKIDQGRQQNSFKVVTNGSTKKWQQPLRPSPTSLGQSEKSSVLQTTTPKSTKRNPYDDSKQQIPIGDNRENSRGFSATTYQKQSRQALSLFSPFEMPFAAAASTTMTSSIPSVAVDEVSSIPMGNSYVDNAASEYHRRGMLTIGFCTLVFASMSPVMHAALGGGGGEGALSPPPVLLLNAAVSALAYVFLLSAGSTLERMIPPSSVAPNSCTNNNDSNIQQQQQEATNFESEKVASKQPMSPFFSTAQLAGMELGLWKVLGTVANLYGLSLTSSDHGAFLIQLTTLIVPLVQGIMGVPIPKRIQASVALALTGVALFTTASSSSSGLSSAAESGTELMNGNSVLLGDALCVVAAGFYATYDLRLFGWGKQIKPRELITNKIATQAALSILLLVLAPGSLSQSMDFLHEIMATATSSTSSTTFAMLSSTGTLLGLVAWSGVMVNAIVPFLQVGGQQAIGPTKAQTLYASQPLCAAIMSFFFLGETIPLQGLVGGGAFLSALFLAATTQPDDDAAAANENNEPKTVTTVNYET